MTVPLCSNFLKETLSLVFWRRTTGTLLNHASFLLNTRRHYDVVNSIEEDSKRYHQNFLFCNNNEITACIADLFNSFCEEVYMVAFLKVMQQQLYR